MSRCSKRVITLEQYIRTLMGNEGSHSDDDELGDFDADEEASNNPGGALSGRLAPPTGRGAPVIDAATIAKNPFLSSKARKRWQANSDRFRSLSEVTQALRQAGLESSNLVVAIDCTKSNKWTGAQSFGGQCLHTIEAGKLNPYQESLKIIGQTLAEFDDDDLIPAFGFGDSISKDKTVFPFSGNPDGICHGLRDVLHKYEKMVPTLHLSGPTSFAPVIRKTIEIVQRERSYHILVIVADGQVTEERETIEAIVLASSYPISIIMVGVGDGPWDTMKDFDDRLPKRYFDNFQFVNFTEFKQKGRPSSAFALAALMEIPDQYHYIRANMM